MEQQFGIVLSGTVIEGFDLHETTAQLAQLFHIEPRQAARMLLGKPTQLKQAFDRSRVKSIHKALTAMGVECRIIVLKQNTPDDHDAIKQPPPAATATQQAPTHPEPSPVKQAAADDSAIVCQGNAIAQASFSLKVSLVCIVILVVLSSLSWLLYFSDTPFLGVEIIWLVHACMVWGLLKAYRLGWTLSFVLLLNGSVSSLGWLLAEQEAKGITAVSLLFTIIALAGLLTPINVRRLNLATFDRVSYAFGGIGHGAAVTLLFLFVIYAANIDENHTVNNRVAEQVTQGIIEVGIDVPSFLSEQTRQVWPVGKELPVRNKQVIREAVFREGNIVDLQFHDSVLYHASITLTFADDGQLLSCATDTIPGHYINPTCINCTCNATSSTVQ